MPIVIQLMLNFSGIMGSMTIFQDPNPPLIILFIGLVISTVFMQGTLHNVGHGIFVIGGAVWAYLEITDGVNWFRRGLGAVVMADIFYNLIR